MDRKLEQEIIRRVQSGERDAYALLVEAYKSPIFNLAFRMTGSYADADDLTQETFVRAYQKLHQFDQRKKYFTWVYTIGINLIRTHLKKKAKDISSFRGSPETIEPKHENKEETLLLEDSLSRLETNVQQLPVNLREAIILKYQQDLTFEEIAAITGASLSTAKMRVYRSLEKLKALMHQK